MTSSRGDVVTQILPCPHLCLLALFFPPNRNISQRMCLSLECARLKDGEAETSEGLEKWTFFNVDSVRFVLSVQGNGKFANIRALGIAQGGREILHVADDNSRSSGFLHGFSIHYKTSYVQSGWSVLKIFPRIDQG